MEAPELSLWADRRLAVVVSRTCGFSAAVPPAEAYEPSGCGFDGSGIVCHFASEECKIATAFFGNGSVPSSRLVGSDLRTWHRFSAAYDNNPAVTRFGRRRVENRENPVFDQLPVDRK
jgi:hypothetical protein